MLSKYAQSSASELEALCLLIRCSCVAKPTLVLIQKVSPDGSGACSAMAGPSSHRALVRVRGNSAAWCSEVAPRRMRMCHPQCRTEPSARELRVCAQFVFHSSLHGSESQHVRSGTCMVSIVLLHRYLGGILCVWYHVECKPSRAPSGGNHRLLYDARMHVRWRRTLPCCDDTYVCQLFHVKQTGQLHGITRHNCRLVLVHPGHVVELRAHLLESQRVNIAGRSVLQISPMSDQSLVWRSFGERHEASVLCVK
jgi:hypothetical protein